MARAVTKPYRPPTRPFSKNARCPRQSTTTTSNGETQPTTIYPPVIAIKAKHFCQKNTEPSNSEPVTPKKDASGNPRERAPKFTGPPSTQGVAGIKPAPEGMREYLPGLVTHRRFLLTHEQSCRSQHPIPTPPKHHRPSPTGDWETVGNSV